MGTIIQKGPPNK